MSGALSTEEKIALHIPNHVELMASERAAGTFRGVQAFWETHRPLSAIPATTGPAASLEEALGIISQRDATIADLRVSIQRRAEDIAANSPAILQLRGRAEKAEALVRDFESGASSDLTKARARIAELESAERSTELGKQVLSLTEQRDKSEQILQRLEQLAGVRGISRAEAIPCIPDREEHHCGTVADYEERMRIARAQGPTAVSLLTEELTRAIVAGKVKK